MIKKLKSLIPDKVKDFIWKYIINYFFHYKNVVKNNFFITSNVNLNDFGNRARFNFFLSARYYLQVNRISGLYAEFGSFGGNTFRMSLNTLGLYGKPNKVSHFYSFDSFEGMPKPTGIDKQKIWRQGMNFMDEEKFLSIMKKDRNRISTVKGFFEKSLENFSFPKNSKIALVYIDCDYYTSTKTVLNFLTDYLSHGMIIAFDDWDCYFADNQRGQRLAFQEWSKKNKKKFYFEKFRTIDSGGISFVVHEKKLIGSSFEG